MNSPAAELTNKQYRTLKALDKYDSTHGEPPTLMELGRLTSQDNPGAVLSLLQALERKGYVKRGAKRAKRSVTFSAKGLKLLHPSGEQLDAELYIGTNGTKTASTNGNGSTESVAEAAHAFAQRTGITPTEAREQLRTLLSTADHTSMKSLTTLVLQAQLDKLEHDAAILRATLGFYNRSNGDKNAAAITA